MEKSALISRGNIKSHTIKFLLIVCILFGLNQRFYQHAMAGPSLKKASPLALDTSLPEDGAAAVKKIANLLPDGKGNSNRLNIEELSVEYKKLRQTDELWPLYTFVLGEARWFKGDKLKAHKLYNALIKRAYESPDSKSGLTVVALWRDLLIRNEERSLHDKEETGKFLRMVRRTISSKSAKWMFRFFFHTALPKLEEEVLRLSARLAWKVGLRDRAKTFLMEDYLPAAGVGKLHN